ncbi:MAG: hypothetical protein R3C03_05815 [Pirellulaceae bacterium]
MKLKSNLQFRGRAFLAFAILLIASKPETLFGWQQQFVDPNNSQLEFAAPAIVDHQVAPASLSVPTPSGNPTSETLDTSKRQLSEMFQGQLGQIDWGKMVASLAIVIGGYLILVWLSRLIHPQSNRALPRQVVEVIGQTRFNATQNLQLVRLGNRLLLLLVGREGTQAIGEVTDPVEVEQLIAACGGKGGTRRSLTIDRRPITSAQPASISPSALEHALQTLQNAFGSRGKTEYEA